MATKSSKKTNQSRSYTNTSGNKIVVTKTGDKYTDGVRTGTVVPEGYRGVQGKSSGSSRMVRVGSKADSNYNADGLYSGKGAETSKYSALNNKPYTPKPISGTTSGGMTEGGASPMGPSTPAYHPRYTSAPTTIQDNSAETYESVQKRLMRDAQKQVNSLHNYEKSLLEEQRVVNEQNSRSTASVNTLTGLAGSTEANVTTKRAVAENAKANEKIRSATEVQVQDVLANVRKDAMDMYKYERSETRLDSAEARLDSAENRQAEADRRTKAITNVTTLAQSGATADGYSKTDPEGYQYLAQSVGGEDVLKAMFTLNRSKETILDKKIEGGKYVIAFENPLDGKIRIETLDLGLPPQYTNTIDAGDRILAIPENWSGDPSELVTINKGLTPSQASNSGNDELGGYTDDQNKVITRVDDKVSKNETYKKTSNMRAFADNVSASLALGTGTGDLSAINQFQKVIDEGAVTRDQDVKLIQNSQSLINKLRTYEKKLTKGEQLSPELRSEMNAAVQSIYQAQIKALAKDPFIKSKESELRRYDIDPTDTIIGELGAFSVQGEIRQIKSPDGAIMDASDLTPEELQEAYADGYTDA
jgi:hypothetical protein